MEIQINPTFSLYISFSLLYLTVATAFSPADNYLIDCGSANPTTVDVDNRRFTGDSSESGSRFLSATQTISVVEPNPDLNSSPVYHTARVFTRNSNYVFEIKKNGTHLVRLHFHRFNSSNYRDFDSQFHVTANEYGLLDSYTGEDTQNPSVKEFIVWADIGKLVIMFRPVDHSKFAFINAIEVISAPEDLISDVAVFVTSEKNEKIDGLIRNAFETVYRVNVGGPLVTPFNDSLWRTWLPDNEFLKSSNDGSKSVYFSGRIKYQLGGASREVGPDNVYNTARVITSSNNIVPEQNITWVFHVTEGYKYLIRLHFCDIASIALGELYFNVYVNGNLAYENLDLTSITNGMLASPFYADFVVDGENSGLLTVSVGPSNMSMAHAVDGILNGIEIMKMNDALGNLGGRAWTESKVNTRPRGKNIGVLIPLVGSMSFLITALMAMAMKNVSKDDFIKPHGYMSVNKV